MTRSIIFSNILKTMTRKCEICGSEEIYVTGTFTKWGKWVTCCEKCVDRVQ